MFDREAIRRAVIKANCALGLERRIVGTKFLFTRKEFDEAEAPPLTSKMRYCVMVERATRGEKTKADFANFGCLGGARALGIVEREEFYLSGRYYKPTGLYQDLATSKEVATHISGCRHRAYGVEVMPLEEYNDEPDIVLIVSYPRELMRLVQGYTFYFGTHDSYKMIGNQAICAECTAHPYETNDINISLLCGGARSAGMKEHEMAIGLPLSRFDRVIDGLCRTITPVERNEHKLKIIERLEANNVTDVPVILDRNYGKIPAARNKVYFKKLRERDESIEEEELPPDIWSPEYS